MSGESNVCKVSFVAYGKKEIHGEFRGVDPVSKCGFIWWGEHRAWQVKEIENDLWAYNVDARDNEKEWFLVTVE